MKKLSLLIVLFLATAISICAQHEPFDCSEEWIDKIKTLAPESPEVTPSRSRKILVFDKFTGYNHWVTPHTSQVIRVLGEKSGAYVTEITKNVYCLETENLNKYDAIVLNNNCSVGPRRDLILDLLDEDESLSEELKKEKAKKLENNLIEYVKNGGGLIVTHGAIVMQNNSIPFSEMVGGSFDYHPPQQEVTLELVDPDHPLVKAFKGKKFVHIDEPYLFNNAYEQKNFKPLLYMDTNKLLNKNKPIEENIRYVAWIKKHGNGRVFYVSPSHNAQSFENSRMLKFYLDGAQYAIGDLKCDDSPIDL
ncbi:ThuA domain-containing protein [uncultured Draconibacterium sp.]|uniref:ThuA domain-containing protein n=1 Tax=uncultured Draconibacterium sp. TaxID=1573823 RepID=UPI002AA81319|nr:ThuA domain-containing protein [uncultured Draconibacterium sp.]